jgi:tetratricopeptide (TPR) repeat protein
MMIEFRRNGRWLSPALAASVMLCLCAGAALADDLKDGRRFLDAGQLDQAYAAFEKAAGQGKAEGTVGKGDVRLKQGRFEEALAAYKAAQQMDGSLASGYYGEAQVYRAQDDCAKAVPLYQKATELDRKFPMAQLALGRCLIDLGRHKDATAALTVGLKWGTDWRPRFLVALGDAELARDSLRDAGVFYTTAREEAPNDPVTHAALGNFYVARGIPGLAIPEYQAAVDLDGSSVEFHHGLGQAFYFDKRYSDALREFEWVVGHDSAYAPGLLSLGNLYYLSGPADKKRYEDARDPLEKYVKLKPKDPKGWSLLGRDLFFLDEHDRAFELLQKAIALGEKSKETFTVMGRLQTERKNWDEALAMFRKGDPEERDLLMMGQIYVIQGKPERAESLYVDIFSADSTRRVAWFALNQLGKLKFRLKDYPATVEVLERRNRLDPNSGEAYYYIGLSYKEMKQYPEALAALKRAAELEPDRSDRQFWLGIMYAQLDSTEQARTAFAQSVKTDSTSATAAVAFRQLGFYALLDKHYAEATHLLERSVELNEGDVQAWVWLAQGYQNAGNRSKALDGYERALQLDPSQPDALKGRQTLAGGGR